jgi:hypothetical protein
MFGKQFGSKHYDLLICDSMKRAASKVCKLASKKSINKRPIEPLQTCCSMKYLLFEQSLWFVNKSRPNYHRLRFLQHARTVHCQAAGKFLTILQRLSHVLHSTRL